MPGEAKRESDSVAVRLIRVSFAATRIRDDLRLVGEPEAFAHLFESPGPVLGVDLGLPFAPDAKVDMRFWSSLTEWKPREPITLQDGRKLRRAGVPLRHRGLLAAPVETPRLEAHVHPFGVVVLVTMDISWDDAVPLPEVWASLGELKGVPARVTVAQRSHDTTVTEAAGVAADALVEILAGSGGSPWEMPDHRIATVIAGLAHGASIEMPPARGPVHMALHRLSSGGDVLPDPGSAFVAQWSGANFAWAPAQLVYMLDAGTSILSPERISVRPDADTSLSARHRRAALLLAHITASVGLVRAAKTAKSPYFMDWARNAANRLARLYGPAIANEEWGLETRSYLMRIGAVDEIGRFLGSPLTEKYPSPPYP